MFDNLPKELNTSQFEPQGYWGRLIDLRIAHQTAYQIREALIIRKNLDERKPLFITIGETNIEVIDKKLIITGLSLYQLGRTLYSETNRNKPVSHFMGRLWTHARLEKHISGIVKYLPGLSLRPIYLIKGEEVKSPIDIVDIIGFQIISRDVVSHFKMKPIFVNEVEYRQHD